MVRTVLLGSVLLVSVSGCFGGRAGRLLSPSPPQAVGVDALTARASLAPDENVRATELQRGPNSSVHLVQIRDREAPHVHTRYDLAVTLAAGKGTLWLNGRPLPMHEGDVAFVPKGTPHYFVNDGRAPAAALVVFAPAFAGSDTAPVP